MLQLSRPTPPSSRRLGLDRAALLVVATLVPLRLVAVTPKAAIQAAAPAVNSAAPAVPVTSRIAAAPAPAIENSGAPAVPTPGEVYVLLVGDGREVTNSGDTADIARARELRHQSGGDLLWARRAGAEYVSCDSATLERAREIFEPQRQLGVRRDELDKQQQALGAQQGRLGVQQANLRAARRRLEDEKALRGIQAPDWGPANNGPGASEIRGYEEEQRRLELQRQMRRIDVEQDDLARQQDALERSQKALTRQQEELRDQQARAAIEAEQQLRGLLDHATASGAAKPIR